MIFKKKMVLKVLISSLAFIICHYTVIKTVFMIFVHSSLGCEDGC